MYAPRMEIKHVGPELDNWELREIWGVMTNWRTTPIDEKTAQRLLRAKDAGRTELRMEFHNLMQLK